MKSEAMLARLGTQPPPVRKSPFPFVVQPFNVSSSHWKSGHINSLPELISFNASNNGDHVFGLEAKSTGPWTRLTHAGLRASVARCVRWLLSNVSLKHTVSSDAPTRRAPVALSMESGLSLLIYEFALMILGVPVLVLSARLSTVARMHLLDATHAESLIVSPRFAPGNERSARIYEDRNISIHVAAPASEWAVDAEDSSSDLPDMARAAMDDVILILHSSGTTGLPKPITLTHRQVFFCAGCAQFESPQEAQGLNVTTLPMFHGFGLVAPLISLAAGKPTVFPAVDAGHSVQAIISLIKTSKAKSLMTVPYLLDEICSMPEDEGIEVLATLDFVGTGGAALGPGIGDRLRRSGVNLLNFYGTTEAGHLSLVFVPKDKYDWRYFRLRTDVKRTLQALPQGEGAVQYQLTIYPYGNGRPEILADRLIRSPDFPDTDFAVVGRQDDVIVLATGEKADPSILEKALTELPSIKGALAVGENRFNLSVLVERSAAVTQMDDDMFKASIWPTIADAGTKMDAFSRIPSSDSVILVPWDKSLPRTDKGSIARKDACEIFVHEIEDANKKLSRIADGAEPLEIERMEGSLAGIVRAVLGSDNATEEVTVTANLFTYGIDSLQALRLRRAILTAVSCTERFKSDDLEKLIPPHFVYSNPSIDAMSKALCSESHEEGKDPELTEQVQQLVEKYTVQFPATAIDVGAVPQNTETVFLLTGSAGSLGVHCLAELARSSRVQRVICLLRRGRKGREQSTDALAYAQSILGSRHITLTDAELAKISTVSVTPAAERLGLSDAEYSRLQHQVTHVIHAAWPMNYLLTMHSFEDQFRFLRSLIILAAGDESSAPRLRRFIFISSIAVVAKIGFASPGAPIPEEPCSVESSVCGVGYADGKLVCEKILEKARVALEGRLETTSIRLGQLSGARKTGCWNANEQVPMMLLSAQLASALPDIHGTLSWTPVDDVATIITEIAESAEPFPCVQHIENPNRQKWSEVLDWIGGELGLARGEPFPTWLHAIASGDQGARAEHPVMQLYDFFETKFEKVAAGDVIMDTTLSLQRSATLYNLRTIDSAIVQKYIEFWKSTGCLLENEEQTRRRRRPSRDLK